MARFHSLVKNNSRKNILISYDARKRALIDKDHGAQIRWILAGSVPHMKHFHHGRFSMSRNARQQRLRNNIQIAETSHFSPENSAEPTSMSSRKIIRLKDMLHSWWYVTYVNKQLAVALHILFERQIINRGIKIKTRARARKLE